MFSSEFYEISKNTFSYRTPLLAASAEVYSEPCQKFKMELFAKIVITKFSFEMLDMALNTPLLSTR